MDAVNLRAETDPAWLPLALEHLDEVLLDHAHCEKKAAANALSLLQSYPELEGLPSQMARLAREECAHLARVLEICESRGLSLGKDPGDPYAQKLFALVRTPRRDRRLDRLLVAAVIEARSHERLALLAKGLEGEPPLDRLYRELARSEDGHQRLFIRLATSAEGPVVARERLSYFEEREAKILREVGLRPAIH